MNTRFRPWELAGIGALGLFWLWLRGVSVYHHGWNSDETQHLHVVWGWTQGLVPYRDFFDNHTPLIALTLWCTYRLGAQVFSKRIGLVAALLCAFYPNHYFKAGEFRTDTLWALLWMAALVELTKPRQSRADRFLAGVALGAAFATSQKTVMLSLVLLVGTLLTCLLARCLRRRTFAPAPFLTSPAGSFTLSFWLGLVLVPGLLMPCFYLQGAWPQMVYCVIRYNLVTVVETDRTAVWADLRRLPFWLVVPAVVVAGIILRGSNRRGHGGPQAWVLLVAGSYCPVLLGLWTLVTAQDYLPYYPVALVTATAGLFWLGRQITQRLPKYGWLSPLLLVGLFGVELGWLVKNIHFADPRNGFRIEQVREVLALTRPDEPVLDAKGGSIYRPRAVPYVMETLMRLRMREGLLANDLAQRLAANRTAVAINVSWFPERTKDFINQNYLWIGLVHVAGKQVHPDGAGAVPFRLAIPNRYVFVDARGVVPGRLDGSRPAGRFNLAVGTHSFVPDRDLTEPCYVLVESAFEAGFTPFSQELAALEPWREAAD